MFNVLYDNKINNVLAKVFSSDGKCLLTVLKRNVDNGIRQVCEQVH